jgi:trigger factor
MTSLRTRVENIESCKKLLEVHVPKEIVSRELELTYRQISKNAHIPGFRPGKAPRQILERLYFEEAREETIRKLLPSSYSEAVAQAGIYPVGLPEISQVELKEGVLVFKAQVEVEPKVRLKNYKNLKLKSKRFEISEQDIQSALEELRQFHAVFKPKEGSLEKGDYFLCDYTCLFEDKPLEEKKQVWLLMEQDKLLPGLYERLMGATAEQKREIRLVAPVDFYKKEVAGKEIVFRIQIREIKYRHLPELNDEFAKDLKFESFQALREKIISDLKLKNERKQKEDLKQQIVSHLVKGVVFDLPSNLVKEKLENLINDRLGKSRESLSEVELEEEKERLRGQLKDENERLLRKYFILKAIADMENIEVSRQELEKEIETMATRLGLQPDALRNYLSANNLLEDLRQQMRQEKTLEFILQHSRIVY